LKYNFLFQTLKFEILESRKRDVSEKYEKKKKVVSNGGAGRNFLQTTVGPSLSIMKLEGIGPL